MTSRAGFLLADDSQKALPFVAGWPPLLSGLTFVYPIAALPD